MLHPKISRLNESWFAKSGFNVLQKIPPVELGLSLIGEGGGGNRPEVGWGGKCPRLHSYRMMTCLLSCINEELNLFLLEYGSETHHLSVIITAVRNYLIYK